MASGIRVNFGTMTKPLHVGRAAQNGVAAAELAARGLTGGGDALDGPWGFFKVFSFGNGFNPDRIAGVLGDPYTIVSPGVSIKPYPCGVLGHPSMDAMRTLVVTHDVKPEQIQAIRLHAGSNILNPLRYGVATSELEAKFSPAFMLASVALRRKAGIHEFTDEFVRSAPVQAMMAKVETILDPESRRVGSRRFAAPSRWTSRTDDGWSNRPMSATGVGRIDLSRARSCATSSPNAPASCSRPRLLPRFSVPSRNSKRCPTSPNS